MNHLTIAPGEEWETPFTAQVTEFMCVEGVATGPVRWALLDSEKRELLAGHPPRPSFEFGGGTPMRPTLPFHVRFKNIGDVPVSVSYRVFGWETGRRVPSAGCAPGCLTLALPLLGAAAAAAMVWS